ncbi:hypothetical protein BX600DRAFT_165898 [Xylariales sp. PMI_506]|nr:hypothetical protein BX600DRAFT_165898 [Xylariales sp. PMI_506]
MITKQLGRSIFDGHARLKKWVVSVCERSRAGRTPIKSAQLSSRHKRKQVLVQKWIRVSKIRKVIACQARLYGALSELDDWAMISRHLEDEASDLSDSGATDMCMTTAALRRFIKEQVRAAKHESSLLTVPSQVEGFNAVSTADALQDAANQHQRQRGESQLDAGAILELCHGLEIEETDAIWEPSSGLEIEETRTTATRSGHVATSPSLSRSMASSSHYPYDFRELVPYSNSPSERARASGTSELGVDHEARHGSLDVLNEFCRFSTISVPPTTPIARVRTHSQTNYITPLAPAVNWDNPTAVAVSPILDPDDPFFSLPARSDLRDHTEDPTYGPCNTATYIPTPRRFQDIRRPSSHSRMSTWDPIGDTGIDWPTFEEYMPQTRRGDSLLPSMPENGAVIAGNLDNLVVNLEIETNWMGAPGIDHSPSLQEIHGAREPAEPRNSPTRELRSPKDMPQHLDSETDSNADPRPRLTRKVPPGRTKLTMRKRSSALAEIERDTETFLRRTRNTSSGLFLPSVPHLRASELPHPNLQPYQDTPPPETRPHDSLHATGKERVQMKALSPRTFYGKVQQARPSQDTAAHSSHATSKSVDSCNGTSAREAQLHNTTSADVVENRGSQHPQFVPKSRSRFDSRF